MSADNVCKRLNIPLNRVEGDLEIQVEIEQGIISQARSSGTMYRGFENMMNGRGALDGLVMTPRICGICSLSHLSAAVQALEDIAGTTPPDNAIRLRNLALMVEMLQSDMRQSILMFMVDFANMQAYASHSLYSQANARYTPLSGTSALQTIRETRRILEVVAIIGGQWPHTSFMVPGGVTSSLDTFELLRCRMILEHFQDWYETNILGCTILTWAEIKSQDDLLALLRENRACRESDLGFLMRFGLEAGLDRIGQGPDCFLSFGGFSLPGETLVPGVKDLLIPAGFARCDQVRDFDPSEISEDISYARFARQPAPTHPFYEKTTPDFTDHDQDRYSWVKAPRYAGQVVETGPLAEMVVSKDPLFLDLLRVQGPSVLARQLARITRPARLLPAMLTWLRELQHTLDHKFYHRVQSIPDGMGAGLIQAVRGGLGHWVRITDKQIEHYQIITPSTWNGSPMDGSGAPGAWEKALEGTPVKDPENPVEAGHVVRSFDPCLVCAVHSVQGGKQTGGIILGGGF
ncbi:nickel-dependent hydrogenase large subunit [Desulfonatronospira sp.]|uniref:nickel-dependent hydrogenase large subunit n=1 Tax=Desulfonatronospira sp. TaxID=1962951 RepID=UPI0025B8D5E5|nr:nickel-dependent hydrogenase large subunit [Desulfonatronospira sp.]